MNKRLLDVTYKEWLDYYNSICQQVCNDNEYCPYHIGNCCLGDILTEKNTKTLENVINEVIDRVVEE